MTKRRSIGDMLKRRLTPEAKQQIVDDWVAYNQTRLQSMIDELNEAWPYDEHKFNQVLIALGDVKDKTLQGVSGIAKHCLATPSDGVYNDKQ